MYFNCTKGAKQFVQYISSSICKIKSSNRLLSFVGRLGKAPVREQKEVEYCLRCERSEHREHELLWLERTDNELQRLVERFDCCIVRLKQAFVNGWNRPIKVFWNSVFERKLQTCVYLRDRAAQRDNTNLYNQNLHKNCTSSREHVRDLPQSSDWLWITPYH